MLGIIAKSRFPAGISPDKDVYFLPNPQLIDLVCKIMNLKPAHPHSSKGVFIWQRPSR